LVCVQVAPSVEVQIVPIRPAEAAASRVPPAEEATVQMALGALVCVHVTPPLVEVKMPPEVAPTTSRMPSAEEAMEFQFVPGALRTCVQVFPLFVEVQIWPVVYTTAASRVPSAEQAMENQTEEGALVCSQVTPL